MTPRILSDQYHVSPQISVEDAELLRDAGYALVICNRPDNEVPPSHHAETIRAAVEAQGLRFEVLPLTHMTMNAENIHKQAELAEGAGGPVLAYCASGTRCTVVWALWQAQEQGAEAVLAAAAKAGYDISGLKPTLQALEEN